MIGRKVERNRTLCPEITACITGHGHEARPDHRLLAREEEDQEAHQQGNDPDGG